MSKIEKVCEGSRGEVEVVLEVPITPELLFVECDLTTSDPSCAGRILL